MIRKQTLMLASSFLLMTGCSSVSGMFDKDEPPPLEGERISVLELQKTLSPDTVDGQTAVINLPEVWSNSSWPQAGGYPGHVMQNISVSTQGLKKAWSSKIGAGSSKALPLTALPVIAEGKVFTLDTKSRASAFDAQTGENYWRTDVQKESEDEHVISGGVAFAQGLVFVTSGYDEVLALSSEDGEIKWRKRLSAPSRAAPTIVDERVFVSTIDSRLIALDVQTGQALWEYVGVAETAGLLGAASPAADQNIVVPVFSSGEVTALRVENGAVAWSDNLSSMRRFGGGLESLSDIKAMPILTHNLVIAISFGGKIAAIDQRTGMRVWQREISGEHTPWVAGAHVFVLSDDNQLVALSLANGSIHWVTPLPSYENEEKKKNPIIWSGPVMANDQLILIGTHGEMVFVDARDGEISNRFETKKTMRLSPVLAQNTLYILSEDGALTAYR